MSGIMVHWDENSNDLSGVVVKNEKRKSKVVQELEDKRMREKIAEEMECQKKFKANDVPEFVKTPMYGDIIRRQEERKLLAKQRSKDMLDMVKPFSFVDKINLCISEKDHKNPDINKSFKATPFPLEIFDPSLIKKMKEKEAARKNITKSRSKALLESSSAPKAVLDHDKLVQKREVSTKSILVDFIQNGSGTFRPKINHEMPNFSVLHQRALNKKLPDKVLHTKCAPFHFETEQRKKKNEQKSERQFSSASPNSNSLSKRPFSSFMSISMDAIPIVATKTSLIRAKNARHQNDQMKQLVEMTARKAQIKEIQNRDLQRTIRAKSVALSPSSGRISSAKSRNDVQRSREYMRELNEMKKRVNNRPLLLELVMERNAKLKAEQKHQDILDEYGVKYTELEEISRYGIRDPHNENEVNSSVIDLSLEPHSARSMQSNHQSIRSNYSSHSSTSYKSSSSTVIKSGHSSQRNIDKEEIQSSSSQLTHKSSDKENVSEYNRRNTDKESLDHFDSDYDKDDDNISDNDCSSDR